ncbi:MAG: hypothetical protein SCARUB_01305 [Candidatus Scalindua rubra]|uniref:Uncharacterized protein n=1 Tax=Candidatus Scalindua rubra TaxID=1872076 RepID=A0A1E3XD57_9BACT|nr:MAG: hypothetical protein SCARUB_01305 [Candidatus Scalindua rubra]
MKRDILKDAKVEATGNIEVNGVVEGAEIYTNGNLTVHGGITQTEYRKIVVEGSIHAKFILGGNIQADKDITVDSEIVNSTVKTLGAVIIPEGRIVGGEITALRGIFVGHAGTRASIPTVLIAGENYRIGKKLLLKRNKIQRIEDELAKLKNIADTFTSKNGSTSTHNQEEYTKILEKITETEQKLQSLIDELEDTMSREMNRAKQLIVVGKMLYPKTILCLGNEKLSVDEERSGPIQAELVKGELTLRSQNDDGDKKT